MGAIIGRSNVNPNLYILRPNTSLRAEEIIQVSSAGTQKSYLQLFADWFNEKANAQVVFKAGRQTVDFIQELSDKTHLDKLGHLFSELRKGFAVGYLFTQLNAILYPAKGESWTKKFTNGCELLSATALNISIFAPIFNKAAEWTGPTMNVATLGADGTKFAETAYNWTLKSGYKEFSPTTLKVAGLALATFVAVFAVAKLVVTATIVSKVVLAGCALTATGLKLGSSFWEYVRDESVPIIAKVVS